MAEGVEGLLHDATRPWRQAAADAGGGRARVVELVTLAEPPGETTATWTCPAMAKAAGVSHRSVQRIWAAHGLKPHRVKTFKLSNDPEVRRQGPGCRRPLCRSARARPGAVGRREVANPGARPAPSRDCPMKRGRCGTMTHDYKRHGTTTLFAALDVAARAASSASAWARTRIRNSSSSSTRSTARTPAGRELHLIVDNYATHKHPQGAGLAGTASEVPFPLHPDLGVLAQRRRGVRFAQTDRATAQSAASSRASSISRPPSTDTSPKPTTTPNPSSGRRDPNAIIEKVRREGNRR